MERITRLLAEIEREVAETKAYTGRARLSLPVIEALRSVPRERFVPVDLRREAYGNYPSYNAHGAYSAVYAFKAAAAKAGSVDKEAVVNALEGLKLEVPTGTIEFRKEDHQAITDAHWGKTASGQGYPHRILNPIKVFKGADVTPPVAATGCSM